MAESGVDLVGLGSAMRAVPPEAWLTLVQSATRAVDAAIAPIVETSAGVGRIIRARFDRLVEGERVLAAQVLEQAATSARRTGQVRSPNPTLLLEVVEGAGREFNEAMRQLWVNLLANELTGHEAHPKVARLLGRMSPGDARLLATLWEADTPSELRPSGIIKMFAECNDEVAERVALERRGTFSHCHLESLGLIRWNDTHWQITGLGVGFIRAVSPPEQRANQCAE